MPIGCARTFGRLGVMRELLSVRAEERVEFLSQVFTLLEGIEDKSQVTDIMYRLRLLSAEKRKDICDFISRMPKEMDREVDMRNDFPVINLLGLLTDEGREELLSYCVARPYLKIFEYRVPGDLKHTWVSWFFTASGELSWVRPAMKFCRLDQCEGLLAMSWYIPRELREEFLGLAELLSQFQVVGEDDRDVFAQVMRHSLPFKERLYDSFIEELNQPDQEAVRRLTDLILGAQGFQVLGIHDEHRLAQAAIQVRTQLEMAAGGDALNPYIIYQQLTAERERAEVASFHQVMHQERPFLFCPRKVFQGAVTVVAPEEVVAKCKGLHITKDRLREFAEGLRGRMSPEIGAAVHDLTGCTIEELNANFQDPFFNILNAPLTEAGVPLNQAMLCAIIIAILDQPDEVAEGEVLSPREKGWLSAFSTIKACQQGKVEGVLLVYRSLPVAYQYGVEKGAPAIETARKFARMTLQRTIEQTLSQDNALMKELTGATVVEQLPHQATYLKNRLGFYLGRQEGVVFDRHTHTLYNHLIDQSSVSLVSTFCRHFTVEQAIGSLIQGFDNLSGEPRLQATVYNGVVNLFEGKIKPDELFTLDPSWALTEKGALALLDSLGIFNEPLPAIVEAVERGEEARAMELFASLPETVKNDIFLAMWQVCGSPLTGDLRYGENGFYGRIEGWSPEELREKRLLAMRKVLLN